MRFRFLLLPAVFVLSIFLGKRPAHLNHREGASADVSSGNDKHDVEPPLIVYAYLSDSLPQKKLSTLGLDEVNGIRIMYATGRNASYFEYEADSNALLNLIASAPFDQYTSFADTICRKISYRDFRIGKADVPPAELELAAAFWTAQGAFFDIYECVKPPFKHTVLVSTNSKRILHRVEAV